MRRRNLDAKFGVEGEFYTGGDENKGVNQNQNDHNTPPRTQPGLWCQWTPTADRLHIEWDGGEKPKEAVMGIVQRDGKAYAKHIPNAGKRTLLKQIKENVSPTARLITDEYYGYTQLKYHGYNHEFVTHRETYVVGDVYTQSVENLWSILKRGIYGVYRVVSPKYLQAYIDEYAWRFNNRQYAGGMLDMLLGQITELRKIQPVLAK